MHDCGSYEKKKGGIGQADDGTTLTMAKEKAGDSGLAWAKRYLKMKEEGGRLAYITKLYSPIFHQDKMLPPEAEMTIDLTANKPDFCLLGSGGAKGLQIRFDLLNLIVPMAQITPAFATSEKFFDLKTKDPITFKTTRYEIYPKGFGPLTKNIGQNNICFGRPNPRQVFIMFVDSRAFNGDYKLDPFNYGRYKMEKVTCRLNGGEVGSMPPIRLNTEMGDRLAMQALHRTLDLGKFEGLGEIGINLENFNKRNNFFAFDLSGCSGSLFADVYAMEQREQVDWQALLEGQGYNGNLTALVVHVYDTDIILNPDKSVTIEPYS